jgi:cold shock protein
LPDSNRTILSATSNGRHRGIISFFKESILSTDTKHGVVWFNSERGFGFLTPDDGWRDTFVHISAVGRSGLREINEGDRVTYSIEVDSKSGKHCAENIRLVA